jgi:hypothetical protein
MSRGSPGTLNFSHFQTPNAPVCPAIYMLLDRGPAYLGHLNSRLEIEISPARSDVDKTRKSYRLSCSVEG